MIEKLDWDSDFFGFNVGKTNLADIIPFPKDFQDEATRQDYKLIYIFHPQHQFIDEVLKEAFLTATGAYLVDNKVVFEKQLQPVTMPEDVRELAPTDSIEKLYDLALQAGIYSRFRTDKNMPAGTFERLYRRWIDNSLNGSINKRILIAGNENLQGLVTINLEYNTASIGLLSVDEHSTGHGFGKKLMQTAEYYTLSTGLTCLMVATQNANQQACSFYAAMGYSVRSIKEVFHWWM